MVDLKRKGIGGLEFCIWHHKKRLKHKLLLSSLWNIITVQQRSCNLSALFFFFPLQCIRYDANHILVQPQFQQTKFLSKQVKHSKLFKCNDNMFQTLIFNGIFFFAMLSRGICVPGDLNSNPPLRRGPEIPLELRGSVF